MCEYSTPVSPALMTDAVSAGLTWFHILMLYVCEYSTPIIPALMIDAVSAGLNRFELQ